MRLLATTLLILLTLLPASAQCVNLASGCSQDFNTLASPGTSFTLPQGWSLFETGTNDNTTYPAGTGSDTAGNTYSFGASGSAERALGMLSSGSLTPRIGACFVNDTGSAITALSVS